MHGYFDRHRNTEIHDGGIMGIFSWIKNAFLSAQIKEKERAYYWVSEAQRKRCRDRYLDFKKVELTYNWAAWHRCMQRERKPFKEYKFVKDFNFIVRFIKELAGIPTREFEIKTKEIPPIYKKPPKIKHPKPKKIKEKKPEKKKIPKKKLPKKKKKKKKIRKPKVIKRKVRGRKLRFKSNLSFNLFSRGLRWKNLVGPAFLLKFKNINQKLLEDIEEITK